MKKLLIWISLFNSTFTFAQVDLFDSQILNFSIGVRSNSFNNFYAKIPHSEVYGSNPGTSSDLSKYLSKDKGLGFSYLTDYGKFDENSFIIANYDGLLNMLYTYIAGGKVYDGPKSTIIGTPSKSLSKLNQMEKYQTTFVNYDILHINALFGKKIAFGFSVNWKTFNFIGPFTYFDDGAIQNKMVYTTFRNGLDTRLTLAPIIAYRHDFDKIISLYSVAGVHFGANLHNSSIDGLGAGSQFNFKYNPFFDFKCYIGKKIGGCISFQYNYISLTSDQNPFVGSANIPYSPQKLSISSYNIQIGLYMNLKK